MNEPQAMVPAREARKCERPGCPVTFVPRTKVHKFCTPRCKKIVVAYKQALRL